MDCPAFQEAQLMVVAAIDIGTNTVLLLVAETFVDGLTMQVLHEEQRIPRLGKEVDRQRNLDKEAMQRVLKALKEYREVIDRDFPGVQRTMVTATSAVRDAGNRETFRSRIEEECGFELRILSGDEEAEWTYTGAVSMLDGDAVGPSLAVDIGGGSTELVLGDGTELIDFHSFDIGSVRFTERYLSDDPPDGRSVESCRTAIRTALDERRFSPTGDLTAIGVAGTVTSLACMEADMREYNPKELNGRILSAAAVGRWVETLSSLTAGEIRDRFPEVMKGRADVILAGVLILAEFLNYYSLPELVVSTGGIRHGAVLMAGR